MHADLLGVSLAGSLSAIGRSLREAFYMFWDTLWALVVGFGLSGILQAFVSRDAIQRRIGDHRPASIARASLYGMVSTSCSYAASAMARSLFAGGADFLAAMVFMFASTNLVLELGVVLLVLIGWQFVAAEFIGGAIMIVFLVGLGSLWLRGRVLCQAQARTQAMGSSGGQAMSVSRSRQTSLGKQIRSAARWSDAASYTMSDLTMLRKEMLAGFVTAGFLTVLVPSGVWAEIFVRGHGFWTILENVAIGPFVALISFVCSVGNVPLAAALWTGGISFGGVVAFIFADLIALPLLLIYRKQYGARMALRMLAVFWLVMSLAGLTTEYLFQTLGFIPTTRHHVVVGDTFRWDATTVVDIIALVLFAGLYFLYRNRERFGGGVGYAKDPVCAMQVDIAHAPASIWSSRGRIYFCSERCRARFEADPARYGGDENSSAADGSGGEIPAREIHNEHTLALETTDRPGTATDPVCGMTVDLRDAVTQLTYRNEAISFCCAHCEAAFAADPASYLPEIETDPICGMTVDPLHAAATRRLDGTSYFFCCHGCAETFDAEHTGIEVSPTEH